MSKTTSPPNELSYPATPFERFLWRRRRRLALASLAIAFVLTIVIGSYFGMQSGISEAKQNSQLQVAHTLGLAMYMYANDHGGKYPQGNSSTAVFQQLLDDEYVSDPAIFYFPMTGKVKATTKRLKSENVCWDVTDALTVNDPTELPLLFSTGYKIDYVSGGKAFLVMKSQSDGMGVFYINNAAVYKRAMPGGIPVIDATFDPKGKTYRQLTPDGPLP